MSGTGDWLAFAGSLLGLAGFVMTSYPPVRAGVLQYRATNWKPEQGKGIAATELRDIAQEFFTQAAGKFRRRDFLILAAGLVLIGLSSILSVMQSCPVSLCGSG